MRTDQAFYEIFRRHPAWLGDLIGRPLPPVRSARSTVFKASQIECDLLLEPLDPGQPHHIVEFQLYYDASIFNRTEFARCLL